MDSLIERAARDLLKSTHAIALTGAGMSTESGIPDFRGPNGIWTKDPEAEKKLIRRITISSEILRNTGRMCSAGGQYLAI